MAQAAIARDVAFLNLSSGEVNALYERLLEAMDAGAQPPAFTELDLEVSPEAAQAAQFLVELLLDE